MQLNPGNDYGTVTGIMPNQDVTIDYEYRKVNSSIRFEANGGNSTASFPDRDGWQQCKCHDAQSKPLWLCIPGLEFSE